MTAPMDGLTDSDRDALAFIAEEMAGLVFDTAILDRLQRLGLAAEDAGVWFLTDAGRDLLAAKALTAD